MMLFESVVRVIDSKILDQEQFLFSLSEYFNLKLENNKIIRMSYQLSKERIDKINKMLSAQKNIFNGRQSRLFQEANEQQGLPYHSRLKNHDIFQSYNGGKRSFQLSRDNNIQRSQSKILPQREDLLSKSKVLRQSFSLQLKQHSILEKTNNSHRKYNLSAPIPLLTPLKQLSDTKKWKEDNNNPLKSSKELKKCKKLQSIKYQIVMNYFSPLLNRLSSNSTAAEIYKMLSPFYESNSILLEYPLVKMYKNCIYFGENQKNTQDAYEGFLIFYESKKVYYGQLWKEKKNGYGIQIDFKDNTIYIGNNQQGQKKGIFTVVKNNETYKGTLKKGLYDGKAQLVTKLSIYKGQFEKGMRHGRGAQFFPQTGLTLSGIFLNNQFSNQNNGIKGKKQMLNPQEKDCVDFNYEFKQTGIEKLPQNSSSYRIKKKGLIKKQNILHDTIQQEQPLAKSQFRNPY